MFSATGSILSGTVRRPDIFSVHTKKVGAYESETCSSIWSRLNLCGYLRKSQNNPRMVITKTFYANAMLGVEGQTGHTDILVSVNIEFIVSFFF